MSQPTDPSLTPSPSISFIATAAGSDWYGLERAAHEDGFGAKSMHPPFGATDRLVVSDCRFENQGPKRMKVTIVARALIEDSCTVQLIASRNAAGQLVGWPLNISVLTRDWTRLEFVSSGLIAPSEYTSPNFGAVMRSASSNLDGSPSGVEVDVFKIDLVD